MMPDMEKVIKELEEAETMLEQAVDRGGEMAVMQAYKCENRVRDALELLKPRILTLDEALGSDDPVYFESNGRMECWVYAYISDDLQCAVFYRFRATEFMLPLSRYKKDWRCWSAPPSYEQSKAVKWE